MKRILTVIAAVLLSVVALQARPGYSKPVDVYQPDGSTVTLLMHGDEFHAFTTTVDGYTVVKASDGYYRYAVKTADGMLAPSAVTARNAAVRTADETAFLTGTEKYLAPTMTTEQQMRQSQAAKLHAMRTPAGGPKKAASIWDPINYNNFKGLVVLVTFTDRQFTLSDPKSFYQKLTSEKDYTDNTKTYYPVNVEGSTRDYFRANSMGLFDPTFDVVGPVQVSRTAASVGGANASNDVLASIFKSALNQINSSVDFSQYDLNNDGYIDMVYFIFAGYGSYVQGNNSGYLWPHANDWSGGYASYMGLPKYDGKQFGRYACGVEIQDYEEYADLPGHPWLDGIGTMCHEFSHVLGLADHYDTNSEYNGANSRDVGEWDVMANGADCNYGLTPVGYSAFERHVLGFCNPEVLSVAGSYSLDAFATGNKAYILNTGTKDDDFYIENRQQTGWDRFLPGHGMLLWRAETGTTSVWKNNQVNANPSHNYLEMVYCSSSSRNVIDLTSESTPALQSWAGKAAVLDLYDITEKDGVVTFNAGKDLYQEQVEDFESTDLVSSDATGVNGAFCQWDLVNAEIASVATEGAGSGQHVGKLLRSGTISSSTAFEKGIRTLKVAVTNGNYQSRFGVKYSTDDGATWTFVQAETVMKKNAANTFLFTHIPAHARIQFAMRATTTSAACYIDDIVLTYENETTPSAIQTLSADEHTASGRRYNLSGQQVDDTYKGIVIVNGRKIIRK